MIWHIPAGSISRTAAITLSTTSAPAGTLVNHKLRTNPINLQLNCSTGRRDVSLPAIHSHSSWSSGKRQYVLIQHVCLCFECTATVPLHLDMICRDYRANKRGMGANTVVLLPHYLYKPWLPRGIHLLKRTCHTVYDLQGPGPVQSGWCAIKAETV